MIKKWSKSLFSFSFLFLSALGSYSFLEEPPSLTEEPPGLTEEPPNLT
ncbi:hypothetical protein LC087_02450 [Bacillus carboniphilus]|uniref:Uncharacterized protein n=1 Tax=Bacillus carboniphilus TaxID=86663 RepID=A0ABY9JUK6_9BACI|nr:hypothetical protein [Bacillus carboniphilus]WLR43089.1 hypothetical protein LC087_02450 [Bacillus carboniphilus]